jgi:glyoxylase-like metal-dependent hydrolase (beta-lactamase superfamily II)
VSGAGEADGVNAADRSDLPLLERSAGGVRVERAVVSGTFSLDGGTWPVDNNVWVLGDDEVCVVVDAAHDAAPVVQLVAGRRVLAVLCTHGHDDHIGAAVTLGAATAAPVRLHPDDTMLWDRVHDTPPDGELADGDVFPVGDVEMMVFHTPGHSPGSCSFYVPDIGVVFTGDTLFQGGPGATGRSFSDFGTIVDSIRDRLLTLPGDTVVLTGHGASTTVGVERPQLGEWLDRGH